MRFASVNLYQRDESLFRLAYESSICQIATVVFYGVAGVAALVLSARLFRHPSPGGPRRWWLLAFGLGCLLVAGEEASWGQTYLGYSTPDFIAPHNVQSEFNLHNLEIPGLKAYWVNDAHWVLTAAIGTVVPLLLVASRKVARVTWALQVPVPPWLTMAACFFAAMLLPTDADLFRQWGPPYNVPSELREFTVAAAVLLWAWAMHREQSAHFSA